MRKILTAFALTLSVAAGATALGAPDAQAKSKFGTGFAVGLGVGVLGSALVNSHHHGHYPHYGHGGHGGHGWVGSQAWLNYCYARYRTFHAPSGTFMGNDGYRHYCR